MAATLRNAFFVSAALVALPVPTLADVDFFDEFVALPAVEAAITVVAEGSALEVIARAAEGVQVSARNRGALDRVTDLVRRQTEAALLAQARAQVAVAMSEEQAAALVDLHATPEGAALIQAAMLAVLGIRQEGGDIAARELRRADRLLQSALERE